MLVTLKRILNTRKKAGEERKRERMIQRKQERKLEKWAGKEKDRNEEMGS